jgi:redox-sensitive bicupin YhaK (pirin superfamily)
MHPHRDIEGITYVVAGRFEHADSLGNGGVLEPGGVQRMRLGRGAEHSERNHSKTEPMQFLQLWILPDRPALSPAVQQKQFTKEDRTDRLLEVVGAEDAPIKVHQKASVYVAALRPNAQVSHDFGKGRAGYLYLIEGRATLNGTKLEGGSSVKILDEPRIDIKAETESELLLVDVPLRFELVGIWRR